MDEMRLIGFPQGVRLLYRLAKTDFYGIHKAIAEAMYSDTQAAFEAEASPEGEKWTPRKTPSKVKTRDDKGRWLKGVKKNAGKLLQKSGVLANSITRDASSVEAEIGSILKYARIHQKGGEAGRKSARVKIPARPYLGIGPYTDSAIEDALDEIRGAA